MRLKFGLGQTDSVIQKLSKDAWKSQVRTAVIQYALKYLNDENLQKTKTCHLSPYTALQPQKYFEYLKPADSRLYFSIRSGTLDIKAYRKYNYNDGDTICRLCGDADETVEHIVNQCKDIPRSRTVGNIFTDRKDDVEVVVSRVKDFIKISEDREKKDDTEDHPTEEL